MADIKLTYEDQEYTLDIEDIDLRQAIIIKDKCDLTLMTLEDGLNNGDPQALKALFWLMMAQNGDEQDIDRVNFKIVKFARALDEAGRREAEAAAAAKKSSPKSRGGAKASQT